MECHVAVVSLMSCLVLGHGAEQVQTTTPNIDDTKQHYNLIPEVVDKLVLLVEQDRNVLKTILTNEALFFENFLIPMVLLSYNASHDAGNCATSEERLGKIRIKNTRKLLEAKIDAKIDEFLRQWSERQSQKELEEYYDGGFWKERTVLYDFVSIRNKGVCGNTPDESPCTAVGALQVEADQAMKKILDCKARYQPANRS